MKGISGEPPSVWRSGKKGPNEQVVDRGKKKELGVHREKHKRSGKGQKNTRIRASSLVGKRGVILKAEKKKKKKTESGGKSGGPIREARGGVKLCYNENQKSWSKVASKQNAGTKKKLGVNPGRHLGKRKPRGPTWAINRHERDVQTKKKH